MLARRWDDGAAGERRVLELIGALRPAPPARPGAHTQARQAAPPLAPPRSATPTAREAAARAGGEGAYSTWWPAAGALRGASGCALRLRDSAVPRGRTAQRRQGPAV
jgi:hypothetical protein